ncbi:hypothetical protein CL617_04125 [archaeon]|nr:hypothetical protein [archaeon]|tara:strand:- start:13664 stop:14392 length:729 start_codon:yes stop_codon:yes gene_type:complete
MENNFRRQTAHKLWISNILSSIFKKNEETKQSYIEFENTQISRVNLVATVVDQFENNEQTYISVTIDDSSAQIRIKSWNEETSLLNNLKNGDTIFLIGKIREYNEERYLIPEFVKTVDILKEISRKLELKNQIKFEPTMEINKPQEQEIKIPTQDTEQNPTQNITEEVKPSQVQEEKIQESPEPIKRKIITSIEKLDQEDGAPIIEVINESQVEESEANKVIEELMKEGEIYQISQGKLKTT